MIKVREGVFQRDIMIKVAELILPIYEQKYPNEIYMRKHLEVAKSYVSGDLSSWEAKTKIKEIYDAAWEDHYNEVHSDRYYDMNHNNTETNLAYLVVSTAIDAALNDKSDGSFDEYFRQAIYWSIDAANSARFDGTEYGSLISNALSNHLNKVVIIT